MKKLSVEEVSSIIGQKIKSFDYSKDLQQVGSVLTVGDGIARVYGLDDVMAGELVEFDNGARGVVLNLEESNVGVAIFGDAHGIREGSKVKRTELINSVPVGESLIGRVVDAMGNPIDGNGPLKGAEDAVVEKKAPGIIARKSVHEPLQTGIKAIDAMIPIGRGQREHSL